MTEAENAILRRIESVSRDALSGQGVILAELQSFRREMDEEKTIRKDHSEHNREDFLRVVALIESERSNNNRRFTDQTDDRQRQFNEQNVKVDGISAVVNDLKGKIATAQGAGWAIVGILGSGVLFVVGTIVAWIQGLIHIKIG